MIRRIFDIVLWECGSFCGQAGPDPKNLGKQIKPVIPIIKSIFKYIVCTETEGRNPMPAHLLSSLFENDKIKIIPNPEEAILWGTKLLSHQDCMAIVGSHCLGPAVSSIFKISFDKY